MLYPSINEIRTKADSRYTLVILAAKRAREIIDGVPKLTEEEVTKPVSIAANEIAENLITYREGQ
ncbi:MAG: DNA-directed RNA polymerase subunit omega [Firmicutes bacterium]|nr:DNA-directed RNA polymerase subunit omega [Bacillota bacterium]MDY2920002.1 DNA-directed RNA polymerase subunit omega [Lentihominibacter sp.]